MGRLGRSLLKTIRGLVAREKGQSMDRLREKDAKFDPSSYCESGGDVHSLWLDWLACACRGRRSTQLTLNSFLQVPPILFHYNVLFGHSNLFGPTDMLPVSAMDCCLLYEDQAIMRGPSQCLNVRNTLVSQYFLARLECLGLGFSFRSSTSQGCKVLTSFITFNSVLGQKAKTDPSKIPGVITSMAIRVVSFLPPSAEGSPSLFSSIRANE